MLHIFPLKKKKKKTNWKDKWEKKINRVGVEWNATNLINKGTSVNKHY